ncbi:MAG: fibronectin type III domain-containing protein [Thermoguttaceae bacterium]|nr:fibronectin type III domain-containing protein [Thermoguttaceae bacterium]
MSKMFARIDSLFGKRGALKFRSGGGKLTKDEKRRTAPQRLRMESLEDRLLLAVTATDYQNICANYEEFGLPSSSDDVNIIEIEAADLTIDALKDAIGQAAASEQDDLIILRTTAGQNVLLFSAAEDALTIEIDPVKNGSITIVAYGTTPLTLDASGYARPLTVGGGSRLNLGNITLRGGTVSGDVVGATYRGGGLFNGDGEVMLKNVAVTANAVNGSVSAKTHAQGGGIYNGEGGRLSVYDSTVSENSVSAETSLLGGGIYNAGYLVLSRSEVTENTTRDSGGGVYNDKTGTATITESSIVGNSAVYDAGLVSVYGGGIFNAGTMFVSTTSISENSARSSRAFGAGVYNSGNITFESSEFFNNVLGTQTMLTGLSGGGALYNAEVANLYNCTVAGNTSKNTYAATPPLTEAQQYLGSGIYNIKTLNVYNSIIALNAKGGNLATSSTATSRGYYVLAPNAEWTSSESAFEYDSSLPLFKADPLFSAGGVLLNPDQADLALAPYSQAVDAGNVGYVQGTVDLAGNSRTNGSAVDLGAYEYYSGYVRTLDTPENLDVTAVSPSELVLTWKSVPNADYYVVRYTTDRISWTEDTTRETRYEMTVTDTDTEIFFTVQAFSDKTKFAPSARSAPVSITPSTLETPQNLEATAASATAISIVWDGVENADGYIVRYWTIRESSYTDVHVADTSYVLTKASGNLTYHISVCAVDSQGHFKDSAFSGEVSLIPGKLDTPTDVRAEVVTGESSILLTWDAVENADSYRITWHSSASPVKYYVQTKETSHTFTKLNQNYKYYFTVQAIGVNPYTDSDVSQEVSAGWSGMTVVTTAADEFDLSNSTTSLREAIYYAGATIGGVTLPTTVTFDPDLAGATCRLSSSLGSLAASKSVTIDASSLKGGFTVDGGGRSRVFTFTGSDSEVALIGLTVRNGLAPAESTGGALSRGGGIYSTAKSLSLTDCTVTGNTAQATIASLSYGNALAYGGGIYAEGKLSLSGTTVSNNSALAATYTTSAAYRADAYGGGIYATDLEMTHSFVTGNTAQAISNQTYAVVKGGGIYGSGTIVNSLIARNTAQADSVRQYSTTQIYAMAFGGGVCQDTDLTITNSTVAKNSAWSTRSKDASYYANGGGVCAISNSGTVTINNSIVLLNNTSYIGAIDPGTLFPTGEYEGYDICLYTGNDDVLVGKNNVSTFNEWFGASADNVAVAYIYAADVSDAAITVSYDGGQVRFTGEDALQKFLDVFFVNVYDSTAPAESLDNEDYRLKATAFWAIDAGNVSLAVEADGSSILYDLDGGNRVLGGQVDIGAYETGSSIKPDSLTVTTTADVVDEGDGLTSLREAIAYAESIGGATVVFDPSLAGGAIVLNADLGTIVITSPITIDASNLLNSDGDPSLLINGSNLADRVMTIQSSAGEVTLCGLIITGSESAASGGAVYSDAKLNLIADQFYANAAVGDGGAVYAASDLSISGGSFENNAASGDGGAVYAAGTLTVYAASFRANDAVSGGAVYAASEAALQSAAFTSNAASDKGGAVYAAGGTSVNGSLFTSNGADYGGAVYAAAAVTVADSALRENNAAVSGGAAATSGNLVLSYSILSGNSAASFGGGVWQSAGTVTAVNSQFDHNAAETGGALYAASGAAADVRSATITANTADVGGGLYAEDGAAANLYNSIAALNDGDDAAGAADAALNAYAVLSSYTDWTNASEGLWTEYDPHYPLFDDATVGGVYTLNLAASQAIDRGINEYAVDAGGKTLTVDLLGNKRIVKTKSDSAEATIDLGVCECQLTDGNNIQHVFGAVDSIAALAGDAIAPAIEHQVVKLFSDADATTLSLRIHFDSSFLTFDSSNPGDYVKTDMTGQGNFTVYSDTENYDGDASTDSYILVTWNNQNRLWSGAELVEIFSALNFTVNGDLDTTLNHTTYIRFSAANITANFQFLSVPIRVSVDRATFDVDGDGAVNISTDVNLVLRYMAGKTGSALTDDLIYENSTRSADQIEAYLDTYGFIFDIDGDGVFNAAVDGELLARYLAGFAGEELVSGISFTSAATRADAGTITTYIKTYLTGVTQVAPTTDNAHVITVSGDAEAVAGESIALNLAHTVEPAGVPLTATTLTLRLYYSTEYFALDTSSLGYYTPGLVGSALKPYVTGTDSANADGDASTDAWIQFTWNNEAGWTWNSKMIGSLVNAVFTVSDVSADSDADPIVSTFHVTSLDRTAGFKMDDVDVDVAVIPSSFDSGSLWLFDIDGSGSVDIATDGNLLMRYLIFGNIMSADGLLISGVSTRGQEEILEYLNSYLTAFDIDGDGVVKLDTDVTYFMKFFAGYRGKSLQIANPSKKAVRKTGDELAAYIKRFIPEDQRTDPTIAAAALPTACVIESAPLPTADELMPEDSAVSDDLFFEPSLAPLPTAAISVKAPAFPIAPARPLAAAIRPEAAARVWEKPMDDDWFLPETAPIEAGAVVFRPADEIAAFDFDPGWPDFF